MTTQKMKIQKIVLVGLLSALVFVSNYMRIEIPVAVGDPTAIHFGNAVCLIAGFIGGPLGGGLAAGIGSAIFDLLSPVYITSAPFTFVFKFAMAFVAGLFMKKAITIKSPLPIIGATLGQLLYILLYLSKTYIVGVLQGSAPEVMLPIIITKFGASITNAIIAIVVATVIGVAIKAAMKKSKIMLT